ncbi:DUF2520 domain-containing protein [Marinicella litoralis]|uniref:Putative short-subunit dehydrogenase-like oxidoreductase (DUF2520 family) n=1 Tax=Marinicella litoralis TaxID=644220 RepID=A0A4R6XS52_9GAMM|nr:DUF2520 domain-containing protein [Marinicella litoralis]TDR20854.1 putative short-subunit dehydrogenase-like oxidoreductase (DUF2520 family) [Marinicella litoralis]
MNRQVPEKIAIVGNGKMAKHMIRYFELVSQPYVQWFRPSNTFNASAQSNRSRLGLFKQKLNKILNHSNDSLAASITDVSTVLLLIPDDQIEEFITKQPSLQGKNLVHFSGSLFTDKAAGCHPLMTFGEGLYDLPRYQSIPFVIDEHVEFNQLFPLFSNPVHAIKPEQKCMYHAMCVMAGNFAQLMWQATGKELHQMGLPADLMSEYLQQNTANFIKDPASSATGPLVRGDSNAIKKHQKALINHPLGNLYQAFCDVYDNEIKTLKRSQV